MPSVTRIQLVAFFNGFLVIDKNRFRPTGVGALIKMHNLYLSLEPGSAFRFLGLFPTTAGPDYPCMTDAVYFSKAFWSKSYLTQNVTHQRATSKLLFWWMLKQMQKSFLPKRRLGTSINSKFLSSYTNYRQKLTLHASSKPKLNPLFSFCLFVFVLIYLTFPNFGPILSTRPFYSFSRQRQIKLKTVFTY